MTYSIAIHVLTFCHDIVWLADGWIIWWFNIFLITSICGFTIAQLDDFCLSLIFSVKYSMIFLYVHCYKFDAIIFLLPYLLPTFPYIALTMVLLYIMNAYSRSSNLILLLSSMAGVIMKLAPQFSYNQTDYFSESIAASTVVERLEVFCS